MAGTASKTGKKGRKFGRNTERSPSMKRYRAEMRWMTNKKKRIARHLKKSLAHAKKRGCNYDRQAENILRQL